ncbi:MAG: DUF2254 family protein [Chloroflexota bacterium]
MNALEQPGAFRKLTEGVQEAFLEFLAIPSGIVAGFVLLAIGLVFVEGAHLPPVDAVRTSISQGIFRDSSTTLQFLTAATTGMMTVTSITFTVLLLAVQQAASNYTPAVLDQFLRRRLNQGFFGYFVGTSLFMLIVLAGASSRFNPVLSAMLALVFAAAGLYFLAALVYVTLVQMAPAVVTNGIHDGTMSARKKQRGLLRRTRRSATLPATGAVPVLASGNGFVVDLDVERVGRVIGDRRNALEVVLQVQIGTYVAFGDVVAEIRRRPGVATEGLCEEVLRAIRLRRDRDLDKDPVHGIEQITDIAWTAMSSAKQNPMAGHDAIAVLRDVLARLLDEKDEERQEQPLPIVYHDGILEDVLSSFESVAVSASESKQHQSFATVLVILATMYDRLPTEAQRHVEGIIDRLLPALGQETLTDDLDGALQGLITVLERAGKKETAQALAAARDRLAAASVRRHAPEDKSKGAEDTRSA